jgi:hypothetical protein
MAYHSQMKAGSCMSGESLHKFSALLSSQPTRPSGGEAPSPHEQWQDARWGLQPGRGCKLQRWQLPARLQVVKAGHPTANTVTSGQVLQDWATCEMAVWGRRPSQGRLSWRTSWEGREEFNQDLRNMQIMQRTHWYHHSTPSCHSQCVNRGAVMA